MLWVFQWINLTEYVDRVMAFTAHGQNFDHFTASGSFLSVAIRRKIFSANFFFSKLTIKICQCLQLTTNFFCHFTAEGQFHPDPPDTVVLLLNFSVAATRSISPDVNWYLKVAVVRNTQWTTKGVQVCVDTALIVSGANTTIHAEPGKHGHVRNSALVLDLYPQGVGKEFFFYFRLLYG